MVPLLASIALVFLPQVIVWIAWVEVINIIINIIIVIVIIINVIVIIIIVIMINKSLLLLLFQCLSIVTGGSGEAKPVRWRTTGGDYIK